MSDQFDWCQISSTDVRSVRLMSDQFDWCQISSTDVRSVRLMSDQFDWCQISVTNVRMVLLMSDQFDWCQISVTDVRSVWLMWDQWPMSERCDWCQISVTDVRSVWLMSDLRQTSTVTVSVKLLNLLVKAPLMMFCLWSSNFSGVVLTWLQAHVRWPNMSPPPPPPLLPLWFQALNRKTVQWHLKTDTESSSVQKSARLREQSHRDRLKLNSIIIIKT